ncbi:MAG TPA: CsgG/HfaB family protein [Pyrinomonadaceae bacterium]|nr:CsgG/HfaB family protein [Pyrinomonadaceae bacterium]
MRQFRSIEIILTALVFTLLIGAGSAAAQARPKIAVLEFKNKANNQWWWHGGAEAAQDVFITELVKLDKFIVIDREQLEELMQERNLTLSGEIDQKAAVKIGKLLGVNYLLTGAVTEYGTKNVGIPGSGISAGKKEFVASVNSQLIDAKTGNVIWSRAETNKTDSVKVSVFGVGGGVDDNKMFDKVMKPTIVNLITNLKTANPMRTFRPGS